MVYRKPLEKVGYLLDDGRAKNLAMKIHDHHELKFPLSVTRAVLFVTNKCNLNCHYCNSICHSMRKWKNPHIKHLLDSLAYSGTKHVQWTGGEASLRDDIVDLVQHSHQLNMNNSMSTNLSLEIDRYISLINAGIERFYISVDCLDSDEYDTITSTHNYLPRVLGNVHQLVNYKRHKDFHITLNITLDSDRYKSFIRDNFKELQEMLQWLIESNVDDFKFLPVHGLYSAQTELVRNTFPSFINISRQLVPPKFKMFHHRLNTLILGGHGFTAGKEHHCYQSFDDRAFDSIGSYACIIQLREGGKPLYLHDDPHEYKVLRLKNFMFSDRQYDPVCRTHCFDLYRDLNERVHYLLQAEKKEQIQL